MTAFSRTQTIAGLIVITIVVIVALFGVRLSDDDSEVAVAPTPAVDINTTPTPVPVLDLDRQSWQATQGGFRGAANTSAPVDCPYIDERVRQENNFLSLTPGLTFICDVAGLKAFPIAPGRIVMKISQPPLNSQKAEIVANGKDGPWIRAAAYGPFVVVDHGTLNGVANVSTVYAGLQRLEESLTIGQAVDPTTPLGTLGRFDISGRDVPGMLTFELLSDDTRFGSDPLRSNPPPASAAAGYATQLAPHVSMPLTTCRLPFGNPDFNVGAPRQYRTGTHNGLDFNCGTTDHIVTAAADGEVLFVVNDYVDAPTEDRDAVLANTAFAGDTPFWTLAMVYGNFVVVAHHLPDSTGSPNADDQVVTIYSHLTEVDPNIVTGRIVETGTPIGRVGNSGTSTAASGITDAHTSVHLHWELHVNDRAVGYLGDPLENETLYQQIICDPGVELSGCPTEIG